MKYSELLVILFLLFFFTWEIKGGINILLKLSEKNKIYVEMKNANEFISKSFKNTCEGKGFPSLCQWQKTCKAMWNLKYIGWSNCRDTMIVSDDYKGQSFYGTWIGLNYNGEVYWKE